MIRIVTFLVVFLASLSAFAELTIDGSDINTPEKTIKLFSQQFERVKEADDTYSVNIKNKDNCNFLFVRKKGETIDLSDQTLSQFFEVLRKLEFDGSTSLVETPGLCTYEFRGHGINLIENRHGEWRFTINTRSRISELYAVSETYLSPQATIDFFIRMMDANDLEKARSCFALPANPEQMPAFLESLGSEELEQFYEILKVARSRGARGIESGPLYELPVTEGQSIFLYRSKADDWQFTPATRNNISKTYDAVVASDKLNILPDWFNDKTLVLRNWQWLGMLPLIFLGVLVQWIFVYFFRRFIEKLSGKIDAIGTMKQMNRAVGMFTLSLTWYILLPLLELPNKYEMILSKGTKLVALICGIWVLNHVINAVCKVLIEKSEETETKLDNIVIPLLRKALKILLYAFGLIFVAQNLNLNVASLLAGLGIGGLAFALAAKDTVENLFGSITVVLDRPFEIGDWIVVDGFEGTVEAIGLRSTKIRTFYCSLVSVPNSALINAKVDNYGRRSYRRIKTYLGLTYSTPPEKIEEFCEGIRELIRQHPYMRKDYYHVYFNQFSAASLDVLLYCFLDTDDWAIELRERQRFFVNILRLADRIGVEFAFPTQTIYMADAANDPTYPPSTSVDMIEKAFKDGRSRAGKVLDESLGSPRIELPDEVKY